MKMKRTIVLLPILLIAASLPSFSKRQHLSQVIGSKQRSASSSLQIKKIALSPSEVVKRYWKASAEGKFAETWKYIDVCNYNQKSSIYRTHFEDLTKLTPQ